MSGEHPAAALVDSLTPAATTPSKERKRPLRTYSRRPVQAREQAREYSPNEPTKSETDTRDAALADSSRLPALSSQDKNRGQPPSRGSILAYFKPLPPSSDKAPSGAASSDPAELPPSSPASSSTSPSTRPRKRRRLTTRPLLSEPGQYSTGAAADETGVPPECCPMTKDASIVVVPSKECGTLRSALSEVAVNRRDHPGAGPGGALANGSAGSKKRAGKRAAKDMTQTTLSLSVQKEPGFTMCGVCDILYNPLNEKDRREHNRRHAARCRIRQKAAGR
ncbi:uncharacterized protein THITE_2089449 [Thermothielavioides terrestris NRRL 8126]|uniref:N-acetyltransferase ESCO zinc-finger domain-containing protein n=1 Tax=Thermothielavioides terrestris (strain ATCC 38088 / NRRL 8126) TaxID=578455 RepID=G2R7P0_THETT|nr:uncharacterized protein THITE_2089449 [Thermothielavioides terrestris NRRL 8126]AEO67949.1 hypothetical protein THITE_2089449 [Thermothielavioides terrestris NRRL 8126]